MMSVICELPTEPNSVSPSLHRTYKGHAALRNCNLGGISMVYSDVSFLQDSRSGVKRFVIGFAAFLAAAGLACREPAAAAPTLTVLHSFTGYPDGIDPLGRLAMDSSGALYGTTYAGGTDRRRLGHSVQASASGRRQDAMDQDSSLCLHGRGRRQPSAWWRNHRQQRRALRHNCRWRSRSAKCSS